VNYFEIGSNKKFVRLKPPAFVLTVAVYVFGHIAGSLFAVDTESVKSVKAVPDDG
jgi:hypothetical protein